MWNPAADHRIIPLHSVESTQKSFRKTTKTSASTLLVSSKPSSGGNTTGLLPWDSRYWQNFPNTKHIMKSTCHMFKYGLWFFKLMVTHIGHLGTEYQVHCSSTVPKGLAVRGPETTVGWTRRQRTGWRHSDLLTWHQSPLQCSPFLALQSASEKHYNSCARVRC